jgi:hypothetical protein
MLNQYCCQFSEKIIEILWSLFPPSLWVPGRKWLLFFFILLEFWSSPENPEWNYRNSSVVWSWILPLLHLQGKFGTFLETKKQTGRQSNMFYLILVGKSHPRWRFVLAGVLEVSVHGQLACCFWACGKAMCHSGTEVATHFMVARKQKEEETGVPQSYSRTCPQWPKTTH